MRTVKILPLFILFLALTPLAYCQNYYWYKGNKINLATDSGVLYLRPDKTPAAPLPTRSVIASRFKIDYSAVQQLSDSEFTIRSTGKIAAGILAAKTGFGYTALLLRNKAATMLVLPRITVELRQGHNIRELLDAYSNKLTLIQDRGFNTYLLGCSGRTAGDILDISNAINETSKIVVWSEPSFYSNVSASDDPLYPIQYYLNNTGQSGGTIGVDINAPEAWAITRGCNALRVAVIDEGVEAHEDFAGRLLPGFTAGAGGGTGAPQNGVKGHGVACAGIIAATHNEIDVKGVAPNVLIVPVNIFPNAPVPLNPGGAATNDEIAVAIDWAWNQGAADVLSCSWGGGAQSNNVDAAILRARTQGRNNRGCPVVFSSGNSSSAQDVFYPGNVDGVITVGACDRAGNIWYYSDRGPSMDLVAPSGDVNLNGDVTTTDRMGANGYEAGNSTQRFGGTSAACPQVSGIALLMLSVNPNLTEAQVRNILQTTATDMGTAGFDNTFGYGRANAVFAVNQTIATLGCSLSGNSSICAATGNYAVTNLPAGATVQWQASPLNIVQINSPNSPQTVLTQTGNGTITLTATVTIACNAVFTLSKSIVVGTISSSKLSIVSQGPNVCPNVPVSFGARYNGSCTNLAAAGITNVTWSVAPSATVINNAGMAGCGAANNNNSGVQIRFPVAGQYNVIITATNACGTTGQSNPYIATASQNFCGGSFATAVSPNPSAGQVTVTLPKETAAEEAAARQATSSPGTATASILPSSTIRQIKVYNSLGALIKTLHYGAGITKTASLDLTREPKGVYILVITTNTGTFTKKVETIK